MTLVVYITELLFKAEKIAYRLESVYLSANLIMPMQEHLVFNQQ
jgi:hypothetical protein